MKPPPYAVGLLLVLGVLALILCRLPLRSALEFGEDERYEVMKGFLCAKGYHLYTDIWNDQPPVHTKLLAGCFKVWEPSILAARTLASAFGALLFAVFYQLVKKRASLSCCLISCFLLLASPLVLTLSASVMLEVPAISIALLSALLAFQWRERRHWAWLIASGCAFGIALQIKLTAAVVAPAIVAELLWQGIANREVGWQRKAARDVIRWLLPAFLVFFTIGFTWGRGSLASSLKSHLSGAQASLPFLEGPEKYPIQWNLFLRHAECVLAALVGLVWSIRLKRWKEVAFPTVLLATVTCIHAVHQPWWNYYYLHFAVPIAWLAGWALTEALRTALAYFEAKRFVLGSLSTWKTVGLCALAAAVFARSETRLEAAVRQLKASPTINSSALLAKMRRYRAATHWVCAQDVMYPFHAQLPVPPELAVVMAKRYWSGQISAVEIINICRKYKPEQILLSNGHMGSEWKTFLAAGYNLSFADKDFALYIRQEVLNSSP